MEEFILSCADVQDQRSMEEEQTGQARLGAISTTVAFVAALGGKVALRQSLAATRHMRLGAWLKRQTGHAAAGPLAIPV
eukprot:15436084-Alexandrium_andersonii.AAC.1